jgi:hypothetical protein
LCFAKLGSLQARDDSENYMILKYLQIIWWYNTHESTAKHNNYLLTDIQHLTHSYTFRITQTFKQAWFEQKNLCTKYLRSLRKKKAVLDGAHP